MHSAPLSPVPSEKLLGPGHGPGVWPLRERLALASALLDVDNQNSSWPGISRQLTRFTTPGRPESWCSARACAKQYALLLDAVELTRRQKTPAEQSRLHILHGTPLPATTTTGLSVAERLVKRLTAEHVDELRARIRLGQKYYIFLKQFLAALESGKLDSQLSNLQHLIQSKSSSVASSASTENPKIQTLKGKDEIETLMCDFKRLWSELDTVYTVPESTWVYPSGPAGTTSGPSGGAVGSNHNSVGTSKSSSTAGTASMNRLCALLAEASSAIQTPCRENSRRTQHGRTRPLGWIRPHSEGTAVGPHKPTAATKAAVATKQRYLCNANKKRIGSQNDVKSAIGRQRKYSRFKHTNQKEHDGKTTMESDEVSARESEVETADECYSSDMVDDHSGELNRESNSGASTPSTTAMCASDADEPMPDITALSEGDRDEIFETPSTKFDDGEVCGTSPGTLSSVSGPERSISTQNGETISHYPSAEDEEPATPAMCESGRVSANSSPSQSTEAAGDQYSSDVVVATEQDEAPTLIAQSELETDSRRPTVEGADDCPAPLLEDPVHVVINQTISEPGMVDMSQSSLRIGTQQDSHQEMMPCLTEPQQSHNINRIGRSSLIVSSPTNVFRSSDQLGSPAVGDINDKSFTENLNSDLIHDESTHSVATITTSEEPATEASIPSSDPHFIESLLNNKLMASQSPVGERTSVSEPVIGDGSTPSSSVADAVVIPSSAELSPSGLGSALYSNLEPTGQLSVANSPHDKVGFSVHEENTKQAFVDLAHFHSSSTPSARELAIELSPANLTCLEGYSALTSSGSDNSQKPLNLDEQKPGPRIKKRDRPRRRSSCKQLISEVLSKGSPVVELSHLMLPFTSPECGNFSVNLQARVTLEPITFHCPTESPRRSSPTKNSPLSSNHSTAPRSTGLRLRFCRQGSQLTVVQPSFDAPVSDENQNSVITWYNDVLASADQALNGFALEGSIRDSSESLLSDDRELEVVRGALQSVRSQVDSGTIADRQALTHELLSLLARIVMTYPSDSVPNRAAKHVYFSVDCLLSEYTQCNDSPVASYSSSQSPPPIPPLTLKRTRKRTHVI